MSYAGLTYRTTEPLKRLIHAPRVGQMLRRVARPGPDDVVLDYGCGDGHLLARFIGQIPRDRLYGYDPSLDMQAQIAPQIRTGAHIARVKDLLAEKPHAFTLIYCNEVCEHLPPRALAVLLGRLAALAAPGARIVIGVPIETGPSGFLKTLYRTLFGRHDASIAKAWRALLGRPIARIAPDKRWYSSHIGFSHARLRAQIEQSGFRIARTAYLPSRWTGALLNNEAYFICAPPP